MTDYIKRKDAINAIIGMPNCYNGFSDTYDKASIIGALEEVPFADVRENNCKCAWCRMAKNNHRRIEFYLIDDEGHVPPECKEYNVVITDIANFCPHCGAMIEE